jgi:ABC-type molybdenum transport system ATPase subunit/photorepair protein PhrA
MHIAEIKLNGINIFQNFQTTLKPGTNNIIGINGSGKQTLLQIVNAIINSTPSINILSIKYNTSIIISSFLNQAP